MSACGRPQTLSDADKLKRIEELYAGYRSNFPDVPEMTPQQLAKDLKAGRTVVVDVREPKEIAVSKIPGALSLEQFRKDAASHRDKPVVFYCTVGYRSGLAARDLLKKRGDVYNLKGGILSWLHAGQSVAGKKGTARRVHVYGAEWDLLPGAYEGVW